jgi:hypothetical protein
MESQNMESGLPIRESRWKKPKIYSTIVMLYFVLMSGLALTFLGFLAMQSYCESVYQCTGDYYGFLEMPAGFVIVFLFVFPSVTSTVSHFLGWDGRFGLSLFTLILWTLILLVFPLSVLEGSFIMSGFNDFNNLSFLGLFGLTCIMYWFLLKDRKQMKLTT